MSEIYRIKDRFRGFLPIVIDVETAGVNPSTDALLELCAVFLNLNASDGKLNLGSDYHEHILPFEGATLDPKSLAFNQIKPYHPFRYAKTEACALAPFFKQVESALKTSKCTRGVLVGHNAWFDLLFLKAAAARSNLTFPLHAFTCFDTASLSALIYGETVLATALAKAGIPFDTKEAHSALYDAKKTAELFCHMINQNPLDQ